MDTLERIRAKITEIEAKLTDLRIAERELAALGPAPARATLARATSKKAAAPAAGHETKARPGRKPKAAAGPRQTIGAAITDALGDQGALSVAEIAARIEATGRPIDKRSISYSLQAMKKQGRVKAADGNWMLAKPRA
jgi:hypothetical protein